MCGFGEKDRRPVDPPPIVQLILDEDHDQHPARRAHRSAIAAALAAASATGKKNAAAAAKKKASFGTGNGGRQQSHKSKSGKNGPTGNNDDGGEESMETNEDDGDETYQPEDSSEADEGSDKKPHHRTLRGRSSSSNSKNGVKQEGSSLSLGKHGRSSDNPASVHISDSDQESQHNSDSDHEDEQEGQVQSSSGDLDEQDPLFVLHVSLWSHDGKEVRNMIATPGQSDPPKLTRILMGSLVVSPILLNNPEGVPGWYFSFPDLSIRTEGTYTLKFSLMRFGSFDFSSSEDGQSSMLVAEEISEPFQVFSAKKFPGMTESTELSKAFAKQGLKIPIRNDLRVRKADRE
ncbi:hypothetical protein FBU30_006013 [Linnemannia zychae]|nr:hypothetical protein FBU30_006013 [Linnemannia zychae]